MLLGLPSFGFFAACLSATDCFFRALPFLAIFAMFFGLHGMNAIPVERKWCGNGQISAVQAEPLGSLKYVVARA